MTDDLHEAWLLDSSPPCLLMLPPGDSGTEHIPTTAMDLFIYFHCWAFRVAHEQRRRLDRNMPDTNEWKLPSHILAWQHQMPTAWDQQVAIPDSVFESGARLSDPSEQLDSWLFIYGSPISFPGITSRLWPWFSISPFSGGSAGAVFLGEWWASFLKTFCISKGCSHLQCPLALTHMGLSSERSPCATREVSARASLWNSND